ncbi:palmitoyltransferase swf1 [Pichia californica]|uniref:Palmitoyltransferase n=1 Tax=Pichia californica TaxID=460514 RepID=A0A9P6WPB9_9ASCO|nr:palmitoyltransferase swf1 [[Candida] californica]KAG0690771.1 palmitoyltransferase swf1 [[Candida] californica]
MIPAIFCNYFSFILAVVSDPGYLTDNDLTYNKSTKIQSEFPYDNLIYYETQCSTCKFNKPSRSKHCSVCDKCVLMFDHHCVWLNNDVAYYTYRWFLLFLFSMCYIIIYGGYLCFYSLNLFMKYSDDIPKNIHKLPFFRKYWLLIKQTNFANEVSGTILLLCILIFPLIAFFFGENLWSIYLGVTTNETGKWSYINQLIEHELLYEFIPKNGDLHTFLILNGKLANGSIQFVSLKEKTPFNSSIGGNLKQIKGWSDMDNIYDKGFWNNFFQRMFPKKL